MSEILQVLEAVDRLNSWVRSRSCHGGLGFGGRRRRVYEIKRLAILAAHAEFPCSHRPLTTLATCRDCGGSGRYTDWGGYTWPHCRACGSSGTVRLQFVETKVFASPMAYNPSIATFRWHSPRFTFPFSEHQIGPETTSVDWRVNEIGRDLSPDEAARDLLLCDRFFPRRIERCYGSHYDRETCPCERHYSLYLGAVADRCAHCGRLTTLLETGGSRCGGRVGRAEFSFLACVDCQTRLGSPGYFQVGIPAELLEPAAVREWVEVNQRRDAEKGRAA